MLFSIDPRKPMRFLFGGFLREQKGHRHIDRGPLENVEVFLVEEGTLFVEADGVPQAASPGTILIHPPGTIQHGYRSSSDNVKHLWFHCDMRLTRTEDRDDLGELRSALAGPPSMYGVGAPRVKILIVPQMYKPRRWGTLLHLAYALCENRPCYEWEKNGLTAAFFSQLSADYALSGNVSTSRPGGSKVSRIREYIEQHVDNALQVRQLRIDRIAAHFDLHPDYLCRLFKKETGSTPQAYILERRIVLACRFLAVGRTVREVAMQAGFGNADYFSQAFKRAMNMTPSEYRKNAGSF